MAANSVLGPIAAHDHGHRVPTHEALDPAFNFPAAGIRHLFGGMNCVEVGRVGREWQLDAALGGMNAELAEQTTHAGGTAVLKDVVQRLEPLTGLERFQFARVGWS